MYPSRNRTGMTLRANLLKHCLSDKVPSVKSNAYNNECNIHFEIYFTTTFNEIKHNFICFDLRVLRIKGT